MEQQKQIKEMQKEVEGAHRFFLEDDDYESLDEYIAVKLFEKGYRRESDTAVKIFDEVEQILNEHISYYREQIANDRAFYSAKLAASSAILNRITTLRTKYAKE